MDGYDVFKRYSAVKAHFCSNYDFVKAKGRTRISIASWNKRNDKYYFEKVGRMYKDSEITPLFISILLIDPNIWVGSLVKQNHKAVFEGHKQRLKELRKRLQIDVENINRYLEANDKELCDIIQYRDGKLPEIYRLYQMNKIAPETVILFEEHFIISKDRDIEDPLWRKDYKHLMKYKNLLYKVVWEDYYDLLKTT
ncbi:MAG: hypothetical protein QM489_00365 [Candidatus Izemoplasma sp.]